MTVLTLTYRGNGPNQGRYHWQRWACPLCQHVNGLMVAGEIVRVQPQAQ